MRVDKVKENQQAETTIGVDITWNKLIFDAEREIDSCKDKISKLRKSLTFFKKQKSLGLEFPRLGNKT